MRAVPTEGNTMKRSLKVLMAAAAAAGIVFGAQAPAAAVYDTVQIQIAADAEIIAADAEITYYSSGPNFKWTVCQHAQWLGTYAILRVKDNTTNTWLGRINDVVDTQNACKTVWAPGKVAGHSYTAELWISNDPNSQPSGAAGSTTFTAPY